MTKKIKYIFVAGGVMSGVGKGVAVSSIAKILQSRGLKVTAVKIDPYVNVDAGTMNPIEHGEVFVLKDGMECDQDMGNYERFLNTDLNRANYMTTGSIYLSVINKERNLQYNGKCVEVVPHIPLEIINKINNAAYQENAEVVIVEIGGTVGEYQNILFLEAVRILKFQYPNDIILILVSYLPLQNKNSELKTKPTQYAVRTLNSVGLQPDFILARATIPLDDKRKEKIAFNCNLKYHDIISAPDVQNIYEIPLNFEKENLSHKILTKLHINAKKPNLQQWKLMVTKSKNAKQIVKIGIVGKYFGSGDFILADSYISVIEAIKHSAYFWGKKPVIEWINAEDFEKHKNKLNILKNFNGIIVPGGFGSRGVEGKIAAIHYCRVNKIPFLGLCYGMQLAVIEFARNVCKLKGANSSEINKNTAYPVIDLLPEQKEKIKNKNYGGTMRLGNYPTILKNNSLVFNVYKKRQIEERHRHRYEVNPQYVEILQNNGLIFSGYSPDKRLMEIIELPKNKHPFFVGTQFHPEFTSRPLHPHPLFKAFIKAAMHHKFL
ncbi:MAG: CTP synthase [Minisyncoccia bacterium]